MGQAVQKDIRHHFAARPILYIRRIRDSCRVLKPLFAPDGVTGGESKKITGKRTRVCNKSTNFVHYRHEYFCPYDKKRNNMYVIGIAGGTGSGKTTVARKIIESLPANEVALIPQDSYYIDATEMSLEERRKINFDHPCSFDWPLLIRQVKALKAGQAIERPTYSYLECNRLKETIHVEPRKVILIEGILALSNKELRDMMDLKVFVDTDPDERLIRVIERDIIERGRTVQMVMERYRRVLKPMHTGFIEPTKQYADLIIPQGGQNEKAITIMQTHILHHLNRKAPAT